MQEIENNQNVDGENLNVEIPNESNAFENENGSEILEKENNEINGNEIAGDEVIAQREFSKEEQVKIGKAVSAERAKFRSKYEAETQRMRALYENELNQLRSTISQNNSNAGNAAQNYNGVPQTILDPETGEYVEINSTIGQILLRNQKVAQRKHESRLMQEYQTLQEKAAEGFTRFENYEDAKNVFINFGTDTMAEALKGVDDPSAIINFLGSNKKELERIANLPLARQQREIYRIEARLHPPKKLVPGAKEPINSINESNNPAVDAENQSYEQRCQYWAQRINGRT